MRPIPLSLVLGVSLSIAGVARADTITLANGRTISARVVRQDATSVTLEVADGKGTFIVPRSLLKDLGSATGGGTTIAAATAAPTSSASAALPAELPRDIRPASSDDRPGSPERIQQLLDELKGHVKVGPYDPKAAQASRRALAGDVPGSKERIAQLLEEGKGHIKVTFDDSARAWPAPTGQATSGHGKIIIRTDDEPTAAPSAPAAAPTLALPRLVIQPPSDVSIEGSGAARALRFATTTANEGEGSLEVRAGAPGTSETPALQQVFRRSASGELELDHEKAVGKLFFHPQHDHWHLDGYARYELLTEALERAPGTAVGDKVSFCLRDSTRVGGGSILPHHVLCSREQQGISPGWADRYGASLEGQSLAIGALPDGVYYLVNTLTAPFESAGDEADRVGATKIKIAGDSVTVLGTLEGKAFLALRTKTAPAPAAAPELHAAPADAPVVHKRVRPIRHDD